MLEQLGDPDGLLEQKNLALHLKAEALIKTLDADVAEDAISTLEQVLVLTDTFKKNLGSLPVAVGTQKL